MNNDPHFLVDFRGAGYSRFAPDVYQPFYERMVPTTWLIKVEYEQLLYIPQNEDEDEETLTIHRVVSGVCISSMGYIVTVTAGIKLKLPEHHILKKTTFEGRRYNDQVFLSLEFVMEDHESGLSVFKVTLENGGNGGPYHYAGVCNNSLDLDSIGHDLVAIDCSVPFSLCRVTNALGTSIFGDMAEEPQELASTIGKEFSSEVNPINMADKYLPLQGIIYRDQLTRFDDKSYVWNSICGSPVFDFLGAIVGLVCMGDPPARPSLAYAIPGQTIQECIQRLIINHP